MTEAQGTGDLAAIAADENFNGRILRGLQRRIAEIDVVRVQDTSMYGASDSEVLRWAADESRVLLTHDRSTLVGHAYETLARNEPMAGVIAVPSDAPIGRVIEDLWILLRACEPEELTGRIHFLPL